MVVVYYRSKGFNVNSSSTHCLVLFEKGYESEDTVDIMTSDYDGVKFFGWEMFNASSYENKVRYLSNIIVYNFMDNGYSYGMFGDEHHYCEEKEEDLEDSVLNLVEEFLGKDARDIIEKDGGIAGIDHQSEISFPQDFATEKTSRDFAKDFCSFVLNNNFSFLGGNDNCENVPTKEVFQHGTIFDVDSYASTFRMRCKKHHNGMWVLFSPDSGKTIILDMDSKTLEKTQQELHEYFDVLRERNPCDEELGLSYQTYYLGTSKQKIDFPISIDLKITDYCTYGCDYCHESSTKDGKHADTKYIKNLINKLSKMGCFEIAFGGGEPTLHPDFMEIMEYCKKMEVVPNFTTRNISFIINNHKKIKNTCGQFAVSIDLNKEKDIKKVEELCKELKNLKLENQGVAQFVLGTVSEELLDGACKVLNEYNVDLSLLGFKDFGFGESFKKSERYIEYKDWWYKVIDSYYVTTYVDTVLYNQSGDKKIYNLKMEEGQFTCYVDAVKKEVSKSSFCSKRYNVPNVHKNKFLDEFSEIYAKL